VKDDAHERAVRNIIGRQPKRRSSVSWERRVDLFSDLLINQDTIEAEQSENSESGENHEEEEYEEGHFLRKGGEIELCSKVRGFHQALPARDKELIDFVYGSNGGEPHNLSEFARLKGRTPQAISKRHRRIKEKLGKYLGIKLKRGKNEDQSS